MTDFKIRTENIKPTKILDYFVETSDDRSIIARLKSDSPIILVGSRGVGKSFLMRVAEAELREEFESNKVLPVYISFTQGAIIQLSSENHFYQWMLARICSATIRSLKKAGITTPNFTLGSTNSADDENYLTKVISEFEGTWNSPLDDNLDISKLPSIDTFKEYIEDICEEAGISCINVYIDEAAHILRPSQQRQFFGLYRDFNSPYINCSAAVYPGVTSFGDYFQPIHDAVFINLNRDPRASGYLDMMKRIVEKQSDSTQIAHVIRNGENFSVLAYAANGNPRLLLKTLTRAPSVSSREVDNTIKEFYRIDIWEEHSLLAVKYPGFKGFIEWGREFIENTVLPELKEKNDEYLKLDKKTSCYFWIHKNAPESIKKSLALLCYTGIITLHSDAMKATRSEIGSRYSVNLGCLFSLESRPSTTGAAIAKNLTIKRMSEYGANHPSYNSMASDFDDFNDRVISEALEVQLDKSVEFLDLPRWLIDALVGLSLTKVRDVLSATETQIQQAYYVGEVRSRYIKNEAMSAVFEYLSG